MRAAAVATALLLWAGAAAAQPVAYVDEVAVHGAVPAETAAAFVTRVLRDAGYTARFATGDAPPCGRDRRCLAERGRRAGARIALRATLLALAGQRSASLFVVEVTGERAAEHDRAGVDLDGSDPELAALLAGFAGGRPGRARRIAAWSLVGAAAALAAGGAATLWHAHSRRSAFFRDHVDESGNVFGISPQEAADDESSARSWALAGSLLLAGAGLSAAGAAVLFIGGGGEAGPPVGLAVAGRF